MGCSIGWIVELLFRRYISASNRERKWINPGYLRGPWLPLYGFGLLIMFIWCESVARFQNRFLLFIAILISMTALEYLAGVISVKLLNVRLWDYSDEWGNLDGLICPKFSVIWGMCGVLYYYFLHPTVIYVLGYIDGSAFARVGIILYFALFISDVFHSIKRHKNNGYLTKR